jgi:GDP-L-fucose synthase
MELKKKKILITGGRGFLGSFVVEKLRELGVPWENLRIPQSKQTDLRIWENCLKVCQGMDIVIHLAASVGGIGYNLKNPGSLFYDNAIMGIQMMEAARRCKVEKYVAVGTVCAYPKYTKVPFKEEDLWNGYPEETNAPYGIAKKIQLVQAQAYRKQYGFNAIFLLPVNLYGPRDNFDLEKSHVIPAIIRKMQEAKVSGKNEVVLWGSGEVSREFLYVEDCAEGIIKATQYYNKPAPVNLGIGFEIKIKDLAELIKELVGFKGKIVWDITKPDGQPRRCLDTTLAKKEFGFQAKTPLKEGLIKTINWYKEHVKCQESIHLKK